MSADRLGVMKATGQAVKLNDNHTDFIICGGMAPRTGKDFQVLWIYQAMANKFYLMILIWILVTNKTKGTLVDERG